MSPNANAPIGIFDSGIGGLTVFAAVRKLLPHESIIYLGDTARVPYGTKSAETVVRYARECADFLMERKVKAIVVACNTASAYALPHLADSFDVPVLGVVEPGCEAALEITKKRAVGVIGTAGTIASNAYGSLLKSKDPNVRVVSRACPLFVPLVEEGWVDNDVTSASAERYLKGLREEGIDALILGCTHYPLLTKTIAKHMGDAIKLVDSAEATACALEKLLSEKGLVAKQGNMPKHHLYVTDLPARFETIAHKFLKGDLPQVSRVDL
ncbi:MAG: glutamate racemase [Pseudomonadota bacterium]